MNKLIIEVECGEERCDGCWILHWRLEGGPYCPAFMDERRHGTRLKIAVPDISAIRCPACLAAEEKLSAIERRYAELVETVAQRTSQAKGKA